MSNDQDERCLICNRLLNQSSDPLSLDCGGDCLGCIKEVEDREEKPECH